MAKIIKVRWSTTHWHEATIDLSDHPGLTPGDFATLTEDLPDDVQAVLGALEAERSPLHVDGTEIQSVTEVTA